MYVYMYIEKVLRKQNSVAETKKNWHILKKFSLTLFTPLKVLYNTELPFALYLSMDNGSVIKNRFQFIK